MKSRLTMGEYLRRGIKGFAVLVLALYIHLWFTKIDEESLSQPTKENTQQVDKSTLKVVTYNMWCNYLVKSKDDIYHKYVQRFHGFANGVKDVDIVFVQEIFIFRAGPLQFSSCATEMVDALWLKGFKYRTNITSTVPYVFGQTNGVAIFSKIPLISRKSEVFNNAGILEYVNNKGFVSAEAVINGKNIAFFTAHTDAHKESIRVLQLNQLAKAVKRYQGPLVIVGGDLNVNALDDHGGKEEYQKMLKLMENIGLKTVFPKLEKTHPVGCFDYIFVSSNALISAKKLINLMTTNGEMVSDHYGLYMEVDMTKL